MWTSFMDMHSGGGTKEEPYEYIYIEAPENEAITIFYNRFGHNPHRVTCTCCGEDYSVSSDETLELITAYNRGSGKISLEDYCNKKDVLIVRKEEIKDEERTGYVPKQGYVWQ